MSNNPLTPQTKESVEKNSSFFSDNLTTYNAHVQQLDTYRRIHESTNEALKGCRHLLDIGNGGVFDYNTQIVDSIVAVDLFFDELPISAKRPSNVVFKTGSALSIPEANASFDSVLMVMVLHHLVGATVRESLENARQAMREAFRVLAPGGKLIIIESCVPSWFYSFERVVFPLATVIINSAISHPVTLQYPATLVANILKDIGTNRSFEMTRIPKGNWVLQYGFKFPSWLTPVCPYRFVLTKSS